MNCKRINQLLIFVIILTTIADAKISDHKFGYISTSVGWYTFESGQSLDGGPLIGIHAGYHLSKPFAFEMGWKTGRFDSHCSSKNCVSKTINGHSFYCSGLYSFLSDEKVTPFVHLGFSNIKLDTDHIKDCYDSFKYGVGFRYYLNSRTAFHSRLSHHITTDQSFHNFSIDFALTFLFDLNSKNHKTEISHLDKKEYTTKVLSTDEKPFDDKLLESDHALIQKMNPIVSNKNKSSEKKTTHETITNEMTTNETTTNETTMHDKTINEKTTNGKSMDEKNFSKEISVKKDTVQDAEIENDNTLEKVVMLPDEQIIDIDFDSVVDTIDQCPDTPENTKVDLAGCPVNIHNSFDEKKFNKCIATADSNLSNASGCHIITPVYFEIGKAKITKNLFYKLDKLVFILKSYPDIQIGIWGHTDNEGSYEYNKKLSLKRSETIANYLIKNKISKNRIELRGFGLAKPVVPNTSSYYRGKNRRVEIILLKAK
jgi:outer membrane protein OmpA-like peptidoglycan-associated protein